MYHVKIQSSDPTFIFGYSKDNIYTNTCLYQAFKCKNQGKDITIELIQDGQPNAYLYGKTEKDGIHKASYYFKRLYKKLIECKDRFPKNQLVKFICSSLWGHSCRFNIKNKTIDEIEEEDLYCSKTIDDPKAEYWIRNMTGTYYELVNMKQPYRNSFARLKPFLLSAGRVITGNVCMLYPEDLVRVHTDGIVFDKQRDDIMTHFKTYPDLLQEKKTTGLIDWQATNNYYNITKKEKHGKYNGKYFQTTFAQIYKRI
jgi:hypothetical protein